MKREEVIKILNNIFDKYDLVEFNNCGYESVSNEPIYELIDKIYNVFEARICKNCQYFKKDRYGIYCELAQDEDRCLDLNENFGCNKFKNKGE